MAANTFYYYVYEKNLQGDIVAVYNTSGTKLVSYTYDAWGNVTTTNHNISGTNAGAQYNPFRYRGYYYDQETKLYYLNSRYYDPSTGRFLNADAIAYLGANEDLISYNIYSYCSNNPIMYYDPSGYFMISTAVIIGAIIGGIIGAAIGGVVAYNVAEENGAEGEELVAWTLLGVVAGGAIGAAVGAIAGYGVGYIAGGTYANGLAAKSVSSGVKSFFSQPNKVHKLLKLTHHNLSGYTPKTAATLMKKTLANGTFEAYKSVQSMYWSAMNSQVTYTVIKGSIFISDMWIK